MPRPSLLTTAEGTHGHAFGPAEWGLLVVISCIWGASFLFIANGLDTLSPATIATARLVLGASTLAVFPAARRPIEREDRGRIALLGVTWMAFPLLMFPVAEQWVASSVAGMLNGAMPLGVAAIASVMLRRPPGRPQQVGLLIGFAGVVLIGLPSLTGGSHTALGAACVLAALGGYALSYNLAVPLIQKYGAMTVQLRVQATGLAYTAPLGLFGLRTSRFAWGPCLSVAVLGVVGTGLAFVLAGRLSAKVGATRGTIFTYLMPVVAIVLGAVFRDEHIAVVSLFGTALVLLGAFVASRAGR